MSTEDSRHHQWMDPIVRPRDLPSVETRGPRAVASRVFCAEEESWCLLKIPDTTNGWTL